MLGPRHSPFFILKPGFFEYWAQLQPLTCDMADQRPVLEVGLSFQRKARARSWSWNGVVARYFRVSCEDWEVGMMVNRRLNQEAGWRCS